MISASFEIFLLFFSAVKDSDYVIHVASPFPSAPPETEDEVLAPAVKGTKSVLEACANSGTVKRVIVTSSVVAIYSMCNIYCHYHIKYQTGILTSHFALN